MTFVTTGLLIAGVGAMAVPILIHLLSRQRRRPVEWAAMRFLLEALRKHRRRLQLEQLLLLATRCLILGLLGAALARPFLESAGLLEGVGSRTIFLILDNGLASGVRRDDADGKPTTALADSVETAQSILAALGPGDTVGLITTARPARGLVVPPSSEHRAIGELLADLEPSEAPTDFAGAFPILRSALDELGPDASRAVVYLLSDFRSGSAPLDVTLPSLQLGDIGTPTLLASPAATERAPNVQITSIEPLRGMVLAEDESDTGQITVRLARSGGELARDVTRVRLTAEGLPPIEPRVVEWDPGDPDAQVDFVVNLASRAGGPGQLSGVAVTAAIEDDALTADNTRQTVVLTRGRVRVVLIDRRHFGADPDLDRLSAGQWIQRALQPVPDGPMDVVDVDPAALDSVDVRSADAVVLPRPDLLTAAGWTVLRDYVRRGGLLLVTPPGEANVHPWANDLVETLDLPWRIGLETIEPDEPLRLADEQPESELLKLIAGDLSSISQPVDVARLVPVDVAQTQARTILAFADGTPALIAGSPRGDDGNGEPSGLVVYLATSPQLDWTSLPAQPLMVPLLHELLKQGIGTVHAAQRLNVGDRRALGLGPVAVALIDPRGERISIDGQGRPGEPLNAAGLYEVVDGGDQAVATLAVNVEPAAARTDPQDPDAVAEWLARTGDWRRYEPGAAAAALRTTDSGAPLASLLLMIVLGLIVVETALARWFSHALPPRGKHGGAVSVDDLNAALATPGGSTR